MYPKMIFPTIGARGAHLKIDPDEKLMERIHKITRIDESTKLYIITADTQTFNSSMVEESGGNGKCVDFFPRREKLDVLHQ